WALVYFLTSVLDSSRVPLPVPRPNWDRSTVAAAVKLPSEPNESVTGKVGVPDTAVTARVADADRLTVPAFRSPSTAIVGSSRVNPRPDGPKLPVAVPVSVKVCADGSTHASASALRPAAVSVSPPLTSTQMSPSLTPVGQATLVGGVSFETSTWSTASVTLSAGVHETSWSALTSKETVPSLSWTDPENAGVIVRPLTGVNEGASVSSATPNVQF